MNDVTRILSKMELGDSAAADQLLPLVYQELRKLAAAKLAQEKPGQTLQATALVHEVYLRLVGVSANVTWDSRGHFFSAAAEAMRRILVERYRAKATQKRGGGLHRIDLQGLESDAEASPFDLIALDEALQQLEREDPDTGNLAKLRIFAGLTVTQAGEAVGLSQTSAYKSWTYAQAWLRSRLSGED